MDRLGDPGHDIRDGEHHGRVHRPPQPLAREGRERLAELALVRVAGVADRKRRPDSLRDGLGDVEVHLGDEGRQHVTGVGPPLQALTLPELVQRAGSEPGVHAAMVTRP
jgi:hypothetical protein